MPKIIKKTFSQQVVEYIKRQLVDGDLKPGDKITELSIAKELSISQPPVREAMQILTSEGIVEVKGKRGKYITKLSPKQIIDSYFAGGVLEANVVIEALAKFTPHAIAHLEQLVEEMRLCAKRNCPAEDIADLDLQFHEYLFEVADNPTARGLWFRSCQAVGKYFFFKRWGDMHGLQRKYERHLEILDAIKTGDKEEVEQVIRNHYSTAGQMISEFAQAQYEQETS